MQQGGEEQASTSFCAPERDPLGPQSFSILQEMRRTIDGGEKTTALESKASCTLKNTLLPGNKNLGVNRQKGGAPTLCPVMDGQREQTLVTKRGLQLISWTCVYTGKLLQVRLKPRILCPPQVSCLSLAERCTRHFQSQKLL